MSREGYLSRVEFFRQRPWAVWLLPILSRGISMMAAGMYVAFLLWLLWKRDLWVVRAVCVPGVSLVMVTVLRSRWNAPRPYQVYQFQPLLEKDTKGKSFPSRHVFSIWILAVALGSKWPVAGVVLGVFGLVLALVRVVAGVHFVRDVLAGILLALFFGWVGFYR